jgi:solute carrier family 35 protein E3
MATIQNPLLSKTGNGTAYQPLKSKGSDAAWDGKQSSSDAWLRPVLYGVSNIVAATSIVFANKLVMSNYGFRFTTALTLLHTLTTLAGMMVFARVGMFQVKTVSKLAVAPLAAAYVGYVVLCNVSLRVNTVGFYQISKICIMPVLILIELVLYGKRPGQKVLMAVVLVLMGVTLATVTDTDMGSNTTGMIIGGAAVLVTALYQCWAGSKQKELQAGSMQLLHQYCPMAALMLALLVPILEPIGLGTADPGPDTILGYPYTPLAVTAIAISSVLGLTVSLTTFLVIGATSSLTYNIVGHLKTVTILAGGCLFFGDDMSLKKLAGISVAMVGIIWYSHMQLQAMAAKQQTPARTASGAIVPSLPDPESPAQRASRSSPPRRLSKA